MTRAEKIEQAQALRAAGLTYREIGERLGVTSGCAQKWLKPDRVREYRRRDLARPGRVESIRAHAKELVERCPSCDKPMPRRTRYKGTILCQECRFREQREGHRERDEQIVKWWNEDGLSMREIGMRLGWSKAQVGVYLYAKLPEWGYEIKPRYQRRAAA